MFYGTGNCKYLIEVSVFNIHLYFIFLIKILKNEKVNEVIILENQKKNIQ